MSAAKFISGPWNLARRNPGMSVGLLGPQADLRLGVIHTGNDEYVANARLITAAPDLYHALIETLEIANRNEDGDWAVRAHAALAKARGEQP